MIKPLRQQIGTVTEFKNGYYTVDCPNVAPAFKTHLLTPAELKSAKIGDTVVLSFYSTHSRGWWVVDSVIAPLTIKQKRAYYTCEECELNWRGDSLVLTANGYALPNHRFRNELCPGSTSLVKRQ